METVDTEIISVLRQFNPWWSGTNMHELPAWRRRAYREVVSWLTQPPTDRALLVSGARQVGKTTLLLQVIDHLLESGVPPSAILYATFDHPILRLAGPDTVIRLWRETETAVSGVEYVFLDEIHSAVNWQVFIKHQVDFEKRRRIAMTGSSFPLAMEGQESGVGRWHTIELPTLSFYEFLQIRKTAVPDIPRVSSLMRLFEWEPARFLRTGEAARALIAPFNEYLLRGGFPECVTVESLTLAQQMLREDIIDKVLMRDMTAFFGVRRVTELEHLFLYLCLHDGGMLDIPALCANLGVKRPTVVNYIALLEAAHLIHQLRPFGYGKEVLRGRSKVYLSDAAIAPSVLLKGKTLLEDARLLGHAVETAFFKHVFTRYYQESIGFSYWRGAKDVEVDVIAQLRDTLIPFEVKYREHITPAQYKGLIQFCEERKIRRGYLITKSLADFGELPPPNRETRIMRIPAALGCYWLGEGETVHTHTRQETTSLTPAMK